MKPVIYRQIFNFLFIVSLAFMTLANINNPAIALMALVGVYYIYTKNYPSLTKQDFGLIMAFMLFFALDVFDFLYHENALIGNMDIDVEFLLVPLILVAFVAVKPQQQLFWAGICAYGIVSAIVALVQVYFLDYYRATGDTHPIEFGDIAMLAGCLNIVGIFWLQKNPVNKKLWWMLAFSLGAIGGFMATSLSATRGAWVALPVVILLFVIFIWNKNYSKKIIILSSLLVVFAFAINVVTQKHHIERAYKEALDFKNGEDRSSSIGARLEMWEAASLIALEKPLLGWGENGYAKRRDELISAGKISPNIAGRNNLHNEYINIYIRNGLLGLLALLFLYLLPLYYFIKNLKSNSKNKQFYALTGAITISGCMFFALTQSFFAHTSGLHTFLLLVVMSWYFMQYGNQHQKS